MTASTTVLRTRLDDQEMNALKKIAKVQDRSVCALVRVAVREFIKQNAQCL
jgi:predicted transcriptional regulator